MSMHKVPAVNNLPKGTTHVSVKSGSFFMADFILGLHYWSTAKNMWKKAYMHPDDLAPL